jgi:hypothetical protein
MSYITSEHSLNGTFSELPFAVDANEPIAVVPARNRL